MNTPKWPGPDESPGQGRLLGVAPRPATTKAFDFGEPAPRGGWPAPGSPVSPPATPLPWPEPGARAPGESRPAAAAGGPRWLHLVGYPVALLVGVAIGVAGVGLSGPEDRSVPAAAPGDAPAAAAPGAPGTDPGSGSGSGSGDVPAGDGAGAGDGASSRPDRGHHFGDTVRLADGSTVTASAPVASDADTGRSRRHVKVKITYAEPGGEPVVPQPDGREVPPAGDAGDAAGAAGVAEAELATLTLRLGVAGNDVIFTSEEEGRTARD